MTTPTNPAPESAGGEKLWRKKPVVIEAVRWNGQNRAECDAFVKPHLYWLKHNHGNPAILTLEGEMVASVGDWIIKGVKGEFYPCKPDIFAATYEPAPTPAAPQPETEGMTFDEWWERERAPLILSPTTRRHEKPRPEPPMKRNETKEQRAEAHTIVDRLFDLIASDASRYTDDTLTTMVAMDIDAITNLVADAWRIAGGKVRDE